jgi:hypothetical protein
MLRRYPWLSLLMLVVVGGSTAYAIGQLRGDWHMFKQGASDTRIYDVPSPTEAEVSDIRRHLSPKIIIEEPLLVNG